MDNRLPSAPFEWNYCFAGKAKEAIVLSSTESPDKHSYNLIWRVESRSPINKFIISLRQVGESQWHNLEVFSTPAALDYVSMFEQNNYEKDVVDGDYTITGLREATVYQIQIAAENAFGRSVPQNIFTFATKGAGNMI